MARNPMPASRNPDIPHPGRTFYAGRWRTDEEIERVRATKRRSDTTARHRDRTTPMPGRTWYAGRWRTPEEVVRVRDRQREKNRARYVPRVRKSSLTPEERARRAAERKLRAREARAEARRQRQAVKAAEVKAATQAPAAVRAVWRKAKPGSIMRRKWPTMADLNASVRTADWSRFV